MQSLKSKNSHTVKETVKETFQLRPLISQSRAARLQEGCPQRNHLMGKGEQENPSELPAVDVCLLSGLHSLQQQGCLECPPLHLLLGPHYSETCAQGPQMQRCPTLQGGVPQRLAIYWTRPATTPCPTPRPRSQLCPTISGTSVADKKNQSIPLQKVINSQGQT